MSRVWRVTDLLGRYLDINSDQAGARGTATVGSPLSSTSLAEDSREIAGIYLVTVSAKDTASTPHTASLQVQELINGANNPYDYRFPGGTSLHTGVKFDGTTPDKTTLPGTVNLWSSSSSLTNGWSCIIWVGIIPGLLRAGNPNGIQIDWTAHFYDPITAPHTVSVTVGDPGFYATVLFVNASADIQEESTLWHRPVVKIIDTGGAIAIKEMLASTNDADQNTGTGGKVEPYHATFANKTTVSGSTYIDFLIGGSTFQVKPVNGTTTVTSTQLLMDDSTEYVVVQSGHPLEGVTFILASTATNTSTANILVFKNTLIRFRTNDGTPPDESDWQTDHLEVIHPPDALGSIGVGLSAMVDIEILAGALTSSLMNPLCLDLIMESVAAGAAGWRD